MDGLRIIYAGPSKCFTRRDNECNPESNYAIYTVFGTNIETEPRNTELYRELRSEPRDKVRISPWVGMMGLKNGIDKSNDSYGHEGFGLIDPRELSENNLELIDFPDPKLDTGLKLIDCNDFSESKPETVIFSNPEPELDLIDFRDFSKLELELIDFSDPEFKLEYSLRLKAIDTEMPLINDKLSTSLITAKRVFRSESIDKVKISSSEITIGFFSGILTGNFFKPSSELGRVKVAKHNLEIKMSYIYLVFITLYLFSGVGVMEFRRSIEKRWD